MVFALDHCLLAERKMFLKISPHDPSKHMTGIILTGCLPMCHVKTSCSCREVFHMHKESDFNILSLLCYLVTILVIDYFTSVEKPVYPSTISLPEG